MALTRKMLKAMGIEDEKIEQIIDAHTETVDAIKTERDKYKEDAEKLPEVQKELDKYKDGKDWKEEYNKEHTAFEDFKKSVSETKAAEQKKALYKQLLTESKIDEKRIDAILKVTNLADLKVKDDKLEDAENLKKTIETEWAGFIVKDKTNGADVNNPPSGNNGGGEGRTPSRASELAKKYHENRYGVAQSKGE